MFAGVSTACFYPELLEKALDYLVRHGVANTEVFFNAPSELEEPYVRRLAETARAGGTVIRSVHPFTSGLEPLLFFSSYRRRFEDGIELYKRFFHAANLLGATILVFHGDRRGSAQPRRRYFDLFGELMEAGRRMGITVAQENVPRCASWCPDFFREMAAYLPEARFVLDVKQVVRAQVSLEEMLAAMGRRLIHVHISDHRPEQDCLPIGEGDLDLAALRRNLEGLDFRGSVLLELYRDNYAAYGQLLESYRALERAFC
ncbi:MAG TPA: sugar phosphate isomerase/epimerase [Candidatus Anaerotruncus excrementipullorum]|uniref:Sugar phosphate isomerase/epimerase n=1 Tax=Candidatus Anaerotruncus excrementipullorum TaxID=2838465 RepID=A0A9D2B818_9FIRM|nr:sugar phosphate isomerase/epimerase [Candidatus Anaerotruncus excrementipullorum]